MNGNTLRSLALVVVLASSPGYGIEGDHCVSPGLVIPPLGGDTVVSELTIWNTGESIADLNVGIEITHTWVGDLEIHLSHGSSAAFVYHSFGGAFGCSRDDIDATFTNLASRSSISMCLPVPPAVFGKVLPHNPMPFGGSPLDGTWTLTVTDNVPQRDGGVLVKWCLSNGTDSSGGAPTPAGDVRGALVLLAMILGLSWFQLRRRSSSA